MERKRVHLRGGAVLALAAAVLAATLLSPVGAAVTKSKVKKISTRSANKVFTQRSAELELTCPAGTTPQAGACLETSSRPDAIFVDASQTCLAVGRRLPSASELRGYEANGGNLDGDDPGQGEGTSDIDADGSAKWWSIQDDGTFALTSVVTAHPFRCVASPTI
jgi:hypothetical protein